MSYNNNKPPYNRELEQFNEYLVQLRQWLSGRSGGGGIFVLLILAVLIWLSTGIYVIQPGEEGVIQTFGRFSSVTGPGLNYHWPWPIQRRTIEDVDSIRRVEIGFRTAGADLKQEVLQEALMLTEDENIVQVELLVQYQIGDVHDFVFNVQTPEEVLLNSAEVALRRTVGQMTIDAVITEERAKVQHDTREFLTQLMDDYQSGILITDVRLQVADPPEQVRDAFQEVVRARADRERLINEAQSYQNNIVPRARGEKEQAIQDAAAFKEQQVLRATGDAQRFLSVLKAYQLAEAVTRERMHIEALEEVLPQVEIILLDEAALGGQVLPFLPLGDLSSEPADQLPTSSPAPEGGE